MAIKLAKSGDEHKLSLKKGADASGVSIHVNLQWRAAAQPAPAPEPEKSSGWSLFGGWGKKNKPAPASAPAPVQNEDLDLGCMWRDKSGAQGVIQALGNSFGSKSASPYIYLDKDDRSGASSDGENLYITRADAVQRVLVFAYIYQGSAFAKVDAQLKLTVSNGEVIEIALDAPSPTNSFCAAALIEVNGDQVTVRKENRYFSGHVDCDRAFGFGFEWTRGSKD